MKKLSKNKFDLNDLLDQFEQIERMGSLKDTIKLIPGIGKQIKDEDIDFSDDPETTEEEWATAVRGNPFMRPKKVATAVRLDADVVHWLKAQGRGYQTRLNAYLRRMMTEELKGKAEGQSKSCLPATSRSGGI